MEANVGRPGRRGLYNTVERFNQIQVSAPLAVIRNAVHAQPQLEIILPVLAASLISALIVG